MCTPGAGDSLDRPVPETGTEMTVATVPITFSSASAFAVAEMPRSSALDAERRVRFLVVSGRQDDGFWGSVGALWLSEYRRPAACS